MAQHFPTPVKAKQWVDPFQSNDGQEEERGPGMEEFEDYDEEGEEKQKVVRRVKPPPAVKTGRVGTGTVEASMSKKKRKAKVLGKPGEEEEDDDEDDRGREGTNGAAGASTSRKKRKAKVLDEPEDDEEEEENSEEERGREGTNGAEDREDEDVDNDMEKYRTVDPEKMRQILAKFSPAQMQRYECYKRSAIKKSNMAKLVSSIVGYPAAVPVTLAFSGIAKLFVGDLIEAARTVMKERKESGPLRPSHVREAHRRMREVGKMPTKTRPALFRG